MGCELRSGTSAQLKASDSDLTRLSRQAWAV